VAEEATGLKLRLLAEAYFDAQKTRVANNNRVKAYKRLMPEGLADKFEEDFAWLVAAGKRLEDEVGTRAEDALSELLVYSEWLRYVKGVGPSLACQMLGFIYSKDGKGIERFPTISSLWKYAGLHVLEGKAPKRRRGERAPWNTKLKTVMWKIVRQMLYLDAEACFGRRLYEQFKEFERSKNQPFGVDRSLAVGRALARDYGKLREGHVVTKEDLPKLPQAVMVRLADGHVHLRAMRKVAKVLLACLWIRWRELEGLPTSKPYSIEKQLHQNYISPSEWVEK